MNKKHTILAAIFFSMSLHTTTAQDIYTEFKKEIKQSGYIHRPLPPDRSRSIEQAGLKKEVLYSESLYKGKPNLWVASGAGSIAFSKDECLHLSIPREVTPWKNSDHTVYGHTTATYPVGGNNWEKYNRISFRIYPDCDGPDNLQLNLYIYNDGVLKIPDEYGREGSHEIHVLNRQWNECYLEITELPRDRITQIAFGSASFGRDRGMGANMELDIKDIRLEQIKNPEPVSGWQPGEGRISYSSSGYPIKGTKVAVMNADEKIAVFQLLDTAGQIAYTGKVEKRTTPIGIFRVMDFSNFYKEGLYILQAGSMRTPAFAIDGRVWENSIWKALNFIFCERCGYAIPGIHSACHADITATHDGRSLSFSGGWHDAGDMSQQALQTGDVLFSLFEMANKMKDRDIDLYRRLREEAEWGLEFILKNRFGDGYRASSVGMAIWTDGMTGNEDDTPTRVHNHPFDNFLLGGIEAYAALSITDDNMQRNLLIKTAKEDFDFALKEHQRSGFRPFTYFWEHSYNTSESQYMATASWAASILYQLTGETYYASQAREFMAYVLDCQRTEPLQGKDKLSGFFYRDKSKKIITHFNHQSREQIYIQALVALCQTQKTHPDYGKWKQSIWLYADYLKKISRYSQPYGMLPSGVYQIDEAKDSLSFYAQHLMPGKNALTDYEKQLKQGFKLDKEHYLKIFPVWFSFRGNTAIHLAMGKAAAICANFLNDEELRSIAQEQLQWVVGKNPFGQSLMYGEGQHYAQQYVALPGEMTGEMPVGIQTKYNEDKPYWPQANNATYKEVWLTSAGKWLSLVAELE